MLTNQGSYSEKNLASALKTQTLKARAELPSAVRPRGGLTFASVLSVMGWDLSAFQGTPCAEQIKELVLSCCEKSCEKSVVEQLDALLQDASRPVGFLLSERLINVPPQVALPMHQQLQ